MKVHLVDGTYELFRAYYGAPPREGKGGREVGATRALVSSLLALLTKEGATHIAVAFDHVIESFRNDLFSGYKTGDGIEPELKDQFPLAEEATRALGIVCWPMIEFEADDALATAADRFRRDSAVEQVRICSPDKDLMQCVLGERVVSVDRRRGFTYDEAAVEAKLGVPPSAIPDYLALVGDSADGIPGIPRWGAKSAGTILSKYRRLEAIPKNPAEWAVPVRGKDSLSQNLSEHWNDALLFRTLATLRTDAPALESVDALEWKGARADDVRRLSQSLSDTALAERIRRWQA